MKHGQGQRLFFYEWRTLAAESARETRAGRIHACEARRAARLFKHEAVGGPNVAFRTRIVTVRLVGRNLKRLIACDGKRRSLCRAETAEVATWQERSEPANGKAWNMKHTYCEAAILPLLFYCHRRSSLR